jgi:hypothetical protein
MKINFTQTLTPREGKVRFFLSVYMLFNNTHPAHSKTVYAKLCQF